MNSSNFTVTDFAQSDNFAVIFEDTISVNSLSKTVTITKHSFTDNFHSEITHITDSVVWNKSPWKSVFLMFWFF